ncbi:F-box protein [Vitis vinifera]|uniref:F-box protein n=1 Tax=Vitis vinifera TaxID=29760 RepID=A0A438CWH0_VITVI|nr:F-box protein [Vitis vinifera]
MVEDDDSIPDHKHCGFLSAVLAINPPQTLDSGTRCHIFGDGSEVGFRSENDVILSPVDSKAKTSTGDSGNAVGGRGRGELGWAVVLVDVYLPIELWSGWQFPRSASTAGALFRHLSLKCPSQSKDCKVSLPSNIEELARGANGGKISKKTCFVEETVLVKRRGLTLLKSTLSSLPIYFMSLFVISCKVSLRVEKIQMDFLGVGGKESSKAGLILFAYENDLFWKQVVVGKYGEEERVGDGKRVRFWKDRWCGEEPLVVTFPELLSIATNKEAWVDQLWE